MFTQSTAAHYQHSAKRRKLSHSSLDGLKLNDARDVDNSSGSESSENGHMEQSLTENPSLHTQRNGVSKVVHAIPKAVSKETVPASGVTKSSVLSMQIQELVQEVQLDDDRALRRARPLIDQIMQIVKKTPHRQSASLADTEKLARKTLHVAIPWSKRPPADIKYSFEFNAPSRVSVRNSVFNSLYSNDKSSFEISVEMPSEIFQTKDYLNHRVFNKRSFYLACIANSLRDGLSDAIQMEFALKDDNELLPILVIEDRTNGRTKPFWVELNACFPPSVGPLPKLSPSQNCVRSTDTSSDDRKQDHQPTPFYNSTLRTLSSTQEFDELLKNIASKCEAFQSYCELGKIWLSQRSFGSAESLGGFGSGEWALMCALLLTGGGHHDHALFSERYSALQLFKAMLQVLCTKDFTDPFTVRGASVEFPRADQPIFLDALTNVNIMYKMTPWSYQRLRHQALLSLAEVNSKIRNSFVASFIVNASEAPIDNDEVYSVDLSGMEIESNNMRRKIMARLYEVLQKGLGDRISVVNLQAGRSKTWPINKSVPKRIENAVTISLLTRPENGTRLLDHGPPAEDQRAAAEFRDFWKEKAELRRFKDGRINESLLWNADSPVTEQVIRYLLPLHFRIPAYAIRTMTKSIEGQQLPSITSIPAADSFRAVTDKYQVLTSTLHQLEGLPLPIRSVSPASGAMSSTMLIQPLDKNAIEPFCVIIQFDSSSRWPDSLPAIQRTKIAFLIKLADLLVENDNTLSTQVGLENSVTSMTGYYNNVFLDIVYPSATSSLLPIVFRLRIHHDRELHLMQSQLTDKSLRGSLRDELQLAMQSHKREFLATPSHITAMRNLTTHFTPLSTTTRLLKKWISVHHLSNNVPDQVLDILAAHVFLNPAPWSPPGSPTTAFLRVLHLLTRWDWAVEPLIVDLSLSQDMSQAQRSELDTRFQAWRKLDPTMNTVSWFIGTNLDNTGTGWTQGNRPPRVIATRISALARASIELVKAKGLEISDADWQSLFTSPLEDFDFLIYLKPALVKGARPSASTSKVSKKHAAIKYKNLELQEAMDIDSIGHDIVALYLTDLESAFGSAAVFFYGGLGSGSAVIAGLWRPGIAGMKEWRVRLGYSTVPIASTVTSEVNQEKGGEEARKCIANKEGMLAEMAMLGDGLVEKITEKEGM